jgi:hypothetical protein
MKKLIYILLYYSFKLQTRSKSLENDFSSNEKRLFDNIDFGGGT